MQVFARQDMPLVFRGGGTEIRARPAGDMTMLFDHLDEGASLGRYMHGLPGDACPCPHWAYVISGKVRIHTAAGDHDEHISWERAREQAGT